MCNSNFNGSSLADKGSSVLSTPLTKIRHTTWITSIEKPAINIFIYNMSNFYRFTQNFVDNNIAIHCKTFSIYAESLLTMGSWHWTELKSVSSVSATRPRCPQWGPVSRQRHHTGSPCFLSLSMSNIEWSTAGNIQAFYKVASLPAGILRAFHFLEQGAKSRVKVFLLFCRCTLRLVSTIPWLALSQGGAKNPTPNIELSKKLLTVSQSSRLG